MSSKTIAVDTHVYEKLAGVKREGESFSRTIDRLIDQLGEAHTGRDILRGLSSVASLSFDDAETMLAVVAENREIETWDDHDLR
ncbi:MAG: antitoxin VapB family protein [Thermoanaerobaculales bacterium]|jgi:predicted CopG family antitoxin|nr:antitoxin VapB family protein [Thermoanaerobaculales bacterium]